MIRMEHGTQPNPVGDAVRELITNSAPSVRQAALQSGVPYTTLHRGLHDGETFTIANLNKIARLAGKNPVIFFKDEEETA